MIRPQYVASAGLLVLAVGVGCGDGDITDDMSVDARVLADASAPPPDAAAPDAVTGDATQADSSVGADSLLADVVVNTDVNVDTDGITDLDVNVSADVNVGLDALFDAAPHKRVFTTSSLHAGNFGLSSAGPSLEDADEICQALADSQLLGGTWQAWLSLSATNAIDRVPAAGGPWHNTDGELVFADKTAWTTTPAASLAWTESGVELTQATGAWTGTASGGVASGNNCGGWESTVSEDGTWGAGDATGDSWTNAGADPCSQTKHFYCYEL